MTRITTRLTAGMLAAAAITAAGAAPASAGPFERPAAARQGAARGQVVSATHLASMSADRVRAWLASEDFDTASVRHGVDTYRLVYRTVDARGRAATASGLAVLPRSRDRRLATVSYTHGTTSYKPDAPSTADGVWGPGAAVTYAAAGFAAVAPDYLGLGLGPGVHPWKDVPSETSASLGMLRAARHFAASWTAGSSSPASRRAPRPPSAWHGGSRTAPTRTSRSARWPRSAAPTTSGARSCPPC
ncbi:hypothetical protein ACQEU6_04690 [Spirillospora sp. CA-108201]